MLNLLAFPCDPGLRPIAVLLILGLALNVTATASPASHEGTKPAVQVEAEEEEQKKEGPTALHETVVVTSSKSPELIGEATAFAESISGHEILDSPSLSLDDALRQVPGFTLFRRSSSLASHPTTQGVSLRGIGPSGTSRTLVLYDGIPLNDPFGGWVYWNRLPRLALDRIEIVRGASSQLYGSSSLGGTIQLLTRRPQQRRLSLMGSGGELGTVDTEILLEEAQGATSFLAGGRFFNTDGFYSIDPQVRGAVDRPVDHRFGNLVAKAFHEGWHLGVNHYEDRRGNGTRLQTNLSRMTLVEGGLQQPRWGFGFYYQWGLLESRFSRVLPDRSEEFLTADQRFESDAVGASLTATPGEGWLVGTDWRRVVWDSYDQNLWGGFIQKRMPLASAVDFQGGVRLDLWENEETQAALSPRVGILWRTMETAHLRASAYRGFRAPTLNELYRPFQVGNVLTLANSGLGSEQLWGLESGIDVFPSERLLFRGNLFFNRLNDPVGNVTISADGGQILRQRRNIGSVDVTGVELETALLLSPRWQFDVAYLYSSSEVGETGLRLPQVPLHQATGGVRWSGPVTVVTQARFLSGQYDDDLNRFRLGGFGVWNLSVQRALDERLEVYLAAENLLDRRFVTALTPDERLGEPRRIYAGLRVILDLR